MEPIDRAEFVTACHTALALARTPEVAAAWGNESACAGTTVGGLTQHLLSQAGHAVRLLDAPPTSDAPIPLVDHYARASWVAAEHDDEANVMIRSVSDKMAAAGTESVLADADHALERLPALLGTPRDPDTIHIPWQGWSLTTNDFLVTRAMELVVHSDDLAASVGVSTPNFPDSVVEHVVSLLAGVAMRRHGQAAVVRTLSRPQRAPSSVSAF